MLLPLAAALSVAAPATEIDAAAMQAVYDEVKTPFKRGLVIRPGDGKLVDCPNVFRHNGRWYMIYVAMKTVGYETLLADSEDLLTWRTLGCLLPLRKEGWDAWQGAGCPSLVDSAWGGSAEIQAFDGKYWMAYIGGALQGYEPDPLKLGMAWTADPGAATPWTRLPEPIMSPDQPEARPFERQTLYKPHVLWDKAASLGAPFVMFYNGKQPGQWVERIGIAVSDDMRHWRRYGDGPVVDNHSGISGDPQIVRLGDLWVMFYFGAFWQPKAFDTFACSRDLAHWTKWTGPHLIDPSEPYDQEYAHKPWLVKWRGVVYHFYCAVGSEGRGIALATSAKLGG
jgi:predicted GH43/DUF377 family glycosyl hydrolase